MNSEDGRVCLRWKYVFDLHASDHLLNDEHLFPDATLEDAGFKCR